MVIAYDASNKFLRYKVVISNVLISIGKVGVLYFIFVVADNSHCRREVGGPTLGIKFCCF